MRYKHICEAFVKFGYTWCAAEHCVFYKWHQGKIVIVVHGSGQLVTHLQQQTLLLKSRLTLKSKFSIMELGEVHWLLGVEVNETCDTKCHTITKGLH